MKRVELLRIITEIAGTHGKTLEIKDGRGPHTKVMIGRLSSSVPRHREINELTARAIIRWAEQASAKEA